MTLTTVCAGEKLLNVAVAEVAFSESVTEAVGIIWDVERNDVTLKLLVAGDDADTDKTLLLCSSVPDIVEGIEEVELSPESNAPVAAIRASKSVFVVQVGT